MVSYFKKNISYEEQSVESIAVKRELEDWIGLGWSE